MQSGSVTAAAKRLNVSQPAVSKMLSEFEAILGFDLFRRAANRIAPTVEAEALLGEIDQLLAHHELVDERIAALRGAKQGRLLLAAPAALLGSVLATVVAKFSHERPQVRIAFEAYSTAQIQDLVVRQEIDLGFVYAPVNLATVRSIPVCQAEIACVFPERHALASRRVVRAEHLHGERIVGFGPKVVTGLMIRDALQRASVPANIVETNSSIAALSLVRAGGAVALVDPFVLSGFFGKLPHARFRPRIEFGVLALCSAYRPLSRLAEAFLAETNGAIKSVSRTLPLIRPLA